MLVAPRCGENGISSRGFCRRHLFAVSRAAVPSFASANPARRRATVAGISCRRRHITGVLKFQLPRNINAGSALKTPRNFPPFRCMLGLFLTDRFMAEVTGIDVGTRVVNTKAGSFSFDFLAIATGARNSYFGYDRWAELAPGLKRIEDATRIRRNILSVFEQAELARDDAERKWLLTFVIIGGGGPTGVETQVTAIGPLGLEYREAQDDPRKATHSNSRV